MTNNRITDEKSGFDGRTLIGTGTRINGEVDGKNDFYLEGEFEGKMKLETLLFVGKNGLLKGEAEALNAIVEGKVEGNLNIKKKVELRSSGQMTGNIVCHQIAIAEGSYFQGGIKMSDGSAANPTYFTEKRKDLSDSEK